MNAELNFTLHVRDAGDPSVGIMSEQYRVECPFRREVGAEDLEFFRQKVLESYNEFAQGELTARYNFELFEDFLKP